MLALLPLPFTKKHVVTYDNAMCDTRLSAEGNHCQLLH